MTSRNSKALVLLAALVTGLAGLSCSSDPSSGVVAGAPQGQVTVNIHDQAAPGIAQALVTVSALELRDTEGVWVPIAMEGSTVIDLVPLVGGVEARLAQGLVPAGTYDAMRVTITGVRVVLDDVDSTAVDVSPPPGPVSVTGVGIIVVEADGATTLTLDLPLTSFQVSGTSVGFNPTISLDATS